LDFLDPKDMCSNLSETPVITYLSTLRNPMVSEFFIDIILPVALRPGVDSASNRNEYQECFLGVKAAGA
jgi:hypothetical protein